MPAPTRHDAIDLQSYAARGILQWLHEQPHRRHRVVDGSLVFVDISGFTAMSERLARLGRVGAEEVTDLLNHTFSRLLAVAYEDDGSLLKFGGDALLLQFDGADHPARAVHAAWGMRRKLRELQPLQSSAGQVRLRMSVGVHTGAIDQFLVGSRHRELIVAGPAATETVRMEGAAKAGEILVSEAVVEALGDRAVFTPREHGFLLRRAPVPTRIMPSPDGKHDEPRCAGMLLSDQVRRRLEAGVAESEHRPSVVGFVKLTGVDDLLATEGAAAAAAALERVIEVVTEAALPDEVCLLSTDVDANGCKLILTAGVPISQEFDGERMLRALRRVVEQDLPLPVRIGVNHGPVFAGVVGPWFRLTYTIIGDAVNTAARVMAHAQPGEVLATAEVLNRSQSLFEVEQLPAFPVKGKKQPLTAWRVGPVTAERARRPHARFRLAGRQEELAALLHELDAATEGPGRVVQLVGPAGIGKSRLVDEIHERRPHSALTMVACNQYESATPYYAIGAILRALLELPAAITPPQLEAAVLRVAPQLTDQLPLLGDIAGVAIADNEQTRELTATYRAERAVRAVCSLLEAVVAQPSILVVEDLHWVDPESWTVLRAIVRTVLPRRRWLLVLTSRHRLVLDTEPTVDERVLQLEPLSPEIARDLVFAAVEEGLVSIDRGRLLLEKAGGNPFFLQELLRAGVAERDLPDSVDALIQTQLDQVPVRDREVLGYAAVLGTDIDVDLLARTAGITPAEQRAIFHRLSTFVEPAPGGEFRFRHALVRDGAYCRLPFRRRRELHRAAADALEAQRADHDRPDLLAVHTYHAHDWARARAYSLDAAAAAAARFANLTAADHYRRALDAGRHIQGVPDRELATTWERLGDALMLASSYEDAIAAYRRARRLSDQDRQVHLYGQIGQLRERQGRFDEALRWLNRAIRLAGDMGTAEIGRLLVEAAIVKIRQGKPQEALALAARAEGASHDILTDARTSYVRAWAAVQLGQNPIEEQQRMLTLFEASGDLIGQSLAYNVVSASAYFRGDWDEAAAAYQQGGALRRQLGDEVAAAVAAGNLGELLSDQGHFDRARGLLEECRTVCSAAGFRSSQHFAEMILGRLEARVGHYAEAEALLRASLVAFEDIRMSGFVYDAHRYLGELAVFRGDHDAALAFADVVERSATLGTPSARSVGLRLRACALLDLGEVDGAHRLASDLVEKLDPDARDYDTALSLVAAGSVLRLVGDPRCDEVQGRAATCLTRLGVVVPGEMLVFGPTSPRSG